MDARVRYTHDAGVSSIDIDDGKVNVMSPQMQAELTTAFDRAERDDGVVVVRGRPGALSAGFDLNLLGEASGESAGMVVGGFELALRILSYPRPVVIARTGHAVAMGAFLLLSGDYRIATTAPARLTANEVAIGLTMPRAAITILRQRLTPAAFERATLLAEVFGPQSAVGAGFLDEVVEPDRFDERIAEVASALTRLDRDAQCATKRRTRAPLIAALTAAIEDDREEFAARVASAAVN
ncbi:crotonase/enoyl-CoA hydratase family protein [Actinomadura sp. LD22]|uniref:Crotonase/enoyl-CoA hydratase family protein n=1 Tax=Actinomadura physcomitrii TaxID=2650748 RepID=A0A6I4MFD1_9ACTN|nr:crotonase/enoyl-CoA hydratase family protein [Actinomadura physcomitrii]MWA00926.1 crotonase/enoyl-CoA hydratase family protein [Actinomadura physcomitrii]